MAGEINLGTLAVHAKLDATGMKAGAAQMRASLQQMAADIKSIAGGMAKQVEGDAGRMAANVQKQTTTAMKAQADAMKRAAGQIADGMRTAGLAVTAGFAIAVKSGADIEKKLNEVRNNTTMTDAEFRLMSSTIKDMAASTSASIGQLADGFMHIVNFGIKAKDATVVLREAMKSAVATGADVSTTANVLAASMHGFGLKTEDAGHAMNVLHLAAALGNQTLEQFNEAAGPTLAFAAALGVPLTDAAAAMSALTRHGFSAAEASTQVRNVLVHVIATTPKAQKALESLSKASGINLVQDFTAAGLASKGLNGVIDDMRKAAEKAGVSLPDAFQPVIHAIRGGIGAMVLGGRAAGDYKDILAQLEAAMRGDLDPTTKAYADTQKTFAFQMGVLRNNAELLAAKIMQALSPAIYSLLGFTKGLLDEFNRLPEGVKSTLIQVAAFGGVALLVTGQVVKWTLALMELRTALLATAGASALLEGAVAILSNPITLTIAAIAALAAAVYLLTKNQAEHADTSKADAQAQLKQAQAIQEVDRRTFDLLNQYEALRAKTKKTADEQSRMQGILDEIGKLNPSLVKGWDQHGHAVGLVADAYRNLAAQMKAANEQAHLADIKNRALSAQGIAEQRDRLQDELDSERDLLRTHSALRRGDFFVPSTGPGPGTYLKGQGGYERQPNATPAELAVTAQHIQSLEAQIKQLDIQGVQALRGGDAGAAAGKLGENIVKQAAEAVKSPQGRATCALFVTEILKAAGAAVPKIASAQGLEGFLKGHGAQAHPALYGRPGDVVMFHGAQYGAVQDNGRRSGFHAGILMPGGMVRQSNDGVLATRPLSSYGGTATAYSLPDSMIAAAAGATGKGGSLPNPKDEGDEDDRKDRLFEISKERLDFEKQILESENRGREAKLKEYAQKRLEIEHQYTDDVDTVGQKQAQMRRKSALDALAAEQRKDDRERIEKVAQAYFDAKHKELEVRKDTFGAEMLQALHERNERAREKLLSPAANQRVYELDVAAIQEKRARAEAVVDAERTRQAVERGAKSLEEWTSHRAAVETLKDSLYDLLHLPEEVATRDAWKEYFATWSVDFDTANAILQTKLAAIRQTLQDKMVQPIADAMQSARDSVAAFMPLSTVPSVMSDQDMSTRIDGLRKDRISKTKAEYDAEIAQADRVYQFDFEMNQLAGESYLRYLNYRLSLAQAGSEEQMSLLRQVHDVEADLLKQTGEQAKKSTGSKANPMKEMLKGIQRDASSIFANLFDNLLAGGKNPFKQFEQAFKSMLIHMAAELAASELMKGLSSLFSGVSGKRGGTGGGGGAAGGDLGALAGGIGGTGIAEGENSIFGSILNPISEALSVAQMVGGLFGKHGLGGLFKGIGKLFHFDTGGVVPGPLGRAMPAIVHGGELVLNRQQQAALGGGMNQVVTLQVTGDNHFHYDADVEQFGQKLAMKLRNSLVTRRAGA